MRTNRRRAIIIKHHALREDTSANERMLIMESYRNAIIKMLDTITDLKLMKMIYEVIHAIMSNR